MEPQEPGVETVVAKTVDAIVRQAMEDHLKSLIRGDPERVRMDFAAVEGTNVADLERMIPAGLTSYAVLRDRVDRESLTSRMVVHFDGATSGDLEFVWRQVDGRFRIVDVKPA